MSAINITRTVLKVIMCCLIGISIFLVLHEYVTVRRQLHSSLYSLHWERMLSQRNSIENRRDGTSSNDPGIKKRANVTLGLHTLIPNRKYPRILCWVLTDPDVLETTRAVRDTWSRRCDKTLFMSSQHDTAFPTVGLPVPPGKKHISAKAKAAWMYIYEHHIEDFDYFVKADPDTYMIVENLKEYLSHFDPAQQQFFGHHYHWRHQPYMAGGPGVILSREAVRKVNTKIFSKKAISDTCMPDGQGEDWKICRCLEWSGAKPVDTRDEKGRERFFVLNLATLFEGVFPLWYMERDRGISGKNCCSDYPIGFHYVSSPNFLVMEYLLYHAKTMYIDDKKKLWT